MCRTCLESNVDQLEAVHKHHHLAIPNTQSLGKLWLVKVYHSYLLTFNMNQLVSSSMNPEKNSLYFLHFVINRAGFRY